MRRGLYLNISYPMATVLVALLAVLAWLTGHVRPHMATILLMCSGCIITNFFISVWLVRKNDSMVGGMPKATYPFLLAFVFLVLAYSCIAASYIVLDGSSWLRTAGIASVLSGQILLYYANSQVHSAIIGEGLKSP